MKKIKSVIADNEPLALQQLKKFLMKDDEIELIAVCRNGSEALEAIRNQDPELVFLDIEMPEMNGIEVVEMLNGDHLPFVVFVTAFDEYAVKAFEVNALDYLLKPFNGERFANTLMRAKNYIRPFAEETETDGEKTGPNGSYLSRLLVKTSQKIFFIKVEEIEWIESSGNYAKIITNEESHMIRSTLKYLEKRLDPHQFVRIHKSTIVNIGKIKELEQWFTGDYEVRLKNGKTLKMSRNYKDVLDRFK